MATRLSKEWMLMLRGSDFPLVHALSKVTQPVDEHCHDFIELAVVISGTGLHIVDGQAQQISRGDAILLTTDEVHSYAPIDSLEIINIWFVPEDLGLPVKFMSDYPGMKPILCNKTHPDDNPAARRYRIPDESFASIRQTLADIEMECIMQSPGYEINAIAALLRLLALLYRGTKFCTSTLSKVSKLESVFFMIERNYSQELRLDDLAGMACMSVNNLIRVFRKATGESPMQYVSRIRVNRAKQLLIEGNMSVTEVALSVGFKDSNYFSRCFKQHAGVSPREYSTRVNQLEYRMT